MVTTNTIKMSSNLIKYSFQILSVYDFFSVAKGKFYQEMLFEILFEILQVQFNIPAIMLFIIYHLVNHLISVSERINISYSCSFIHSFIHSLIHLHSINPRIGIENVIDLYNIKF
jgi:hypothetical protein